MMKQTLLTALLTCQLALALPTPQLDKLDRPGNFYAPEQRQQILLEAEKQYRKQAHQEGLVDIECRRLEALKDGDPAFPPRLEALRAQVGQLGPGTTRARLYWQVRRLAIATDDRLSEDRFEELALSEPHLPAPLKAFWLSQIYRPEKEARVLKDLRALYQGQPGPEVQWFWLLAQQRSQAGKDLELSLALARLQLAERQGWAYEQFQVLRSLSWTDEGAAYLERFRRFPLTQKASPLRDAMLLEVSHHAETLSQRQHLLRLLQKPLSALETQADLVRYRAGVSPEMRRDLLQKLISSYHQRREVEKEIEARTELAKEWSNLFRFQEAVGQFQAARQLRLDHPPPEPAWCRLNLGDLTEELAKRLQSQQHLHQALALLENTLAQGAAPRLRDQMWIHYTCLSLLKQLGDEAGLEKHWLALVELVARLPKEQQGEDLWRLYGQTPNSQAARRGPLLAQARRCAEIRFAQELSATTRSGTDAASLLASMLREEGDRAGERAVWQKVLERGQREGHRYLTQLAQVSMMYSYGNHGKFLSDEDRREFARVVRAILSQPASNTPWRRQALDWGCYLAPYGDPETLAWADELVREARPKGGHDLAAALRRRAGVQLAFKRYQAALASLGEIPQHDPSLPGDGLARSQAEILWAAGEQDKALEVLRASRERILTSEIPYFALADVCKLAEYREARGEDWEFEYISLLDRYESMGEKAEIGRSGTLFAYLKRLAELEQWQRGREVLGRHPWRASRLDRNTQSLQAFPAWADLLPPAAEASQTEAPGSLIEVLDELRLSRPDLGQLLSLRSTNLRHLQSRLGPDETLVTYCTADDQLYVLALRSEGGFYRKSGLGARQLKALQKSYLELLSSDPRSEAEATLYGLLVEPVLTAKPHQRLYLAPTGDLWELPFGALRDARGQSLAAQAEVVMLSSGDLLRLADNDWKPYRLSQPLAIGAPPGADLPGAYAELGEVAQLLPNCQLSRGLQATTDVLYQPGRQWGLLHFASHAHYRPDHPTESDIQLHDAPLKLKQLSQLSLAERSLVALSCCQGGAAAGQGLDEPVTLATGFSAAGAETVVANLWRVDDQVARSFFAGFYRQLAAGLSPGQSFRSAQDECRRLYPNPRDWGGFFLLGNPM